MNTKQYFTSAVCRPYNIPTPTYPTLSQAPWTETESSAWPCTGELSRGQFTISIGTHLNTVELYIQLAGGAITTNVKIIFTVNMPQVKFQTPLFRI